MSDKVLVKFECNWADEFDMKGMIVMDRTKWAALDAKAQKWFEANPSDIYEEYFGTNEAFSWTDYKEWRDCYKVVEITEDEAVVLMKYSNRENIVGEFAWPEFAVEDEGDEE